MQADWLAWQVVDSAFPTGAFAHSWGIEAAWQHGEVDDVPAVEQLLDDVILQTGRGVLPFVSAAYEDPGALARLDTLADAFLVNPVSNRASRQQGRTLLATARRLWPSAELSSVVARVSDGYTHLAPVSGAVFHAAGLSLETAQRIVLYSAARGVLSAAVRLGIAGSYEAQRPQLACGPRLESVWARCRRLRDEDIAQTAPLLDLIQAGHDRLYSRLFQS